MSDLWFKRKKYGWGWTPITWQGWAVTLGYGFAAGFYIGFTYVPKGAYLQAFLLASIASIPLVAICYLKGPKPRWQWGEEKKG